MGRDPFDAGDEFFQHTFRSVDGPHRSVLGKQFEECRFDHCLLQEADLSNCTFRDSSFVGCDLSVMKVVNCRFVDVAFTGCKVTGVDWTAAQQSAIGTGLTFEQQSILDYSVFSRVTMRNTSIRDCTAREVDFTDADLSGSDFSGTDLTGARFHGTNLSKAHLEGAFGYTIDPTVNQLKGARVSLPEAASLLECLGIRVVDDPGPGEAPRRDRRQSPRAPEES
jgi:fluoroquinolone resistance protein